MLPKFMIALITETCAGCGYQLRWCRLDGPALGDYYETGLCAKCTNPKEVA